MKKIFKRALSAILATVMTVTSVSILSIGSFAEGVVAGSFTLTTSLTDGTYDVIQGESTLTAASSAYTIAVADITKAASFTIKLKDTKKLIGDLSFDANGAKLNTELSKDNQSVNVSIPADTLTSASAVATKATITLVDAVVWIGGKDTKTTYEKDKVTVKVEGDLNKTATLPVVGMYAGGTWTPIVTDSSVVTAIGSDATALGKLTDGAFVANTVVGSTADPAPTYVDAKGKVDATYKNTLTAKISKGVLTVTAGKALVDYENKSTEFYNVWVAEINTAKAVTYVDADASGTVTAGDVKPFSYTVAVKNPAASLATNSIEKATAADKAAMIAVGQTKTFYFNPIAKTVKVDKTTTKAMKIDDMARYTVTLKETKTAKDSDYVDLAYNAGDEFFTLTGKALVEKSGKKAVYKATVVITDTETGKVTNFGVTVNNTAKTVVLGDDISLAGSAITAPSTTADVSFTYYGDETTATDKFICLSTSVAPTSDADLTNAVNTVKGELVDKTKEKKVDGFTASFDAKTNKLKVGYKKTAVNTPIVAYVYLGVKGGAWDCVKVTIGNSPAEITEVKPTMPKLAAIDKYVAITATPEAGAKYTVDSVSFKKGTTAVAVDDAITAGTYTATIVLKSSEGYMFKSGIAASAITSLTGYKVTKVVYADANATMTLTATITVAAAEVTLDPLTAVGATLAKLTVGMTTAPEAVSADSTKYTVATAWDKTIDTDNAAAAGDYVATVTFTAVGTNTFGTIATAPTADGYAVAATGTPSTTEVKYTFTITLA